jgi:hypothetical protein
MVLQSHKSHLQVEGNALAERFSHGADHVLAQETKLAVKQLCLLVLCKEGLDPINPRQERDLGRRQLIDCGDDADLSKVHVVIGVATSWPLSNVGGMLPVRRCCDFRFNLSHMIGARDLSIKHFSEALCSFQSLLSSRRLWLPGNQITALVNERCC